jgi:predicted MFS family arabinose efflux permease
VSAAKEQAAEPSAAPRIGSLYRNRDFTLLFAGQLVSVVGSRMSLVAFPLLVLALTGSPGKAGLSGFFATLPYLLWHLPAGVLVDRLDRKTVMICSEATRGLAFASLVIADLLGMLTFGQILVVAFIEGTGFVFFSIAEMAALPNLVSKSELPLALGQIEARTRAASLAGQPLGGFLFAMGRTVPFLADALSYLISTVCLLFIRRPMQQIKATKRMDRAIVEGVTFLWRQRFLRLVTVLVSGTNLLVQAVILLTIVLARERGASPAMVGGILGVVGASALIGSFAAPWLQRTLPARTVVIGSIWIWVAVLPLFAVDGPPLALGLFFGAAAFFVPVSNVVYGNYELRLTPNELFGRVRAVIMLVAWGSLPLGSLVGGMLLETVGTTGTIWVLAGAMMVLAAVASVSRAVRTAPPIDTAVASR